MRHAAAMDKKRIREDELQGTKLALQRRLKPTLISPPIVEKDFVELEDGALVEMIEDPDNSSRTLWAVFRNGKVRLVDQIKLGERILKPFPRDSQFLNHVCLPRGVQSYKSAASILLRMNEEVLSRCLDLDDDHLFLLACFVLSTWFIDSEHMPVAPYLALVGLPGSGKSTVLKILRMLCRRGLLTADLSSAAFYRACERFMPTLLIDETATAGEKKKLFHLLKIGTSHDVVALRKDQSFSAYGAKVVAWNQLPSDTALNSRCIVIPMHETDKTNLARPSDPEIIAAAVEIQKQLLWYRLEKLKSLDRTNTSAAEDLPARAGDLYEALALGLGQHARYRNWLLGCCRDQVSSLLEPLPPEQAAVLQSLYRVIHIPLNRQTYLVADLTLIINTDLKEAGVPLRLTPRGVGAALSSLGITNRRRTNQGWVVWMDPKLQQRIHKLIDTYGLDSDFYLPHKLACDACELCDPNKDVRNYSLESIPKPRPSVRDLSNAKSVHENSACSNGNS